MKSILNMKWFVVAIFAIAMVSCQQEGAEKSVTEIQAGKDAWADAVKFPMTEDGKIDSSRVAEFAWEEEAHNFGPVDEGKVVEYSYKFKNVGQVPLIISEAKGSCGCTVPEKPEKPVEPGEEGEIKVKFNSQGRVGKQLKYVTITANTLPRETKLKLEGEVAGKEEEQ